MRLYIRSRVNGPRRPEYEFVRGSEAALFWNSKAGSCRFAESSPKRASPSPNPPPQACKRAPIFKSRLDRSAASRSPARFRYRSRKTITEQYWNPLAT